MIFKMAVWWWGGKDFDWQSTLYHSSSVNKIWLLFRVLTSQQISVIVSCLGIDTRKPKAKKAVTWPSSYSYSAMTSTSESSMLHTWKALRKEDFPVYWSVWSQTSLTHLIHSLFPALSLYSTALFAYLSLFPSLNSHTCLSVCQIKWN